MDGFAGLPVQFLKVWQAYPANIKLAQRNLADRETRNSQVIHAIAATVQKARTLQIRQETMHRTHRQPGQARNLLCCEPMRRLAEEPQKAQSTLQRSDVVASLWTIRHENWMKSISIQNESANYLMKVNFMQ
jgi:hypothetical protein